VEEDVEGVRLERVAGIYGGVEGGERGGEVALGARDVDLPPGLLPGLGGEVLRAVGVGACVVSVGWMGGAWGVFGRDGASAAGRRRWEQVPIAGMMSTRSRRRGHALLRVWVSPRTFLRLRSLLLLPQSPLWRFCPTSAMARAMGDRASEQ
jgi:hypothetical protein